MTVYVCVPKDAVQDLDDHFVVSLGDGEEAVRVIMSAMASRSKVATVGHLQAVEIPEDE